MVSVRISDAPLVVHDCFLFFRLLNDKREQAREDLKGLEETVVCWHISHLILVSKDRSSLYSFEFVYSEILSVHAFLEYHFKHETSYGNVKVVECTPQLLTAWLTIIPSIHPSIYPSIHLSIHPSIHPPTHIPTHPSILRTVTLEPQLRFKLRSRPAVLQPLYALAYFHSTVNGYLLTTC